MKMTTNAINIKYSLIETTSDSSSISAAAVCRRARTVSELVEPDFSSVTGNKTNLYFKKMKKLSFLSKTIVVPLRS